MRRNRAKVVTGWNALNDEEMALLQLLYDQNSFYLRFTDNYGKRVVKEVYGGPLDGKSKKMDPQTYKIVLRTDVTMNFIEV